MIIIKWGNIIGKNKDDSTPPTENLLMRLAFHDCIPYKGGKIDKGEGKGCLPIFPISLLFYFYSIVYLLNVNQLTAAMAASTGKGWTGSG